ncbi:MFS sugar transporter-like protein [Aureobasidium sp. EXF-8846]|nr:MFS sugar transporter-like protein [Aureobasidium sp. EXF-8846]
MEAPTKGHFRLAGREFPKVNWLTDPGLRRNYICLMFVVITSATNGYDGSMMNGLQALKIWQSDFHYPSAASLGLLNAIMSVGSLVALPIVPYLADGLGRRAGILVGCILMIIGVVVQSAAMNLNMFIGARFLIGFGVAVAHGASPLLLTELTHPQHRALFTSIYNTTWYLGSIVAAWLTFGTFHINNHWSWRIPSIVQAFPSVLQLIFIWFVPESPRFLISKGKVEQAHQVLANVHANGNLDDEVVMLEMAEIRDTIKLEQEFEANGWVQLFKTPGNRHRLIILCSVGFFSQWSGNGLVSYYLTLVLDQIGITDTNTQLIINGVLQIVNMIVAVGQCFFVDKIGRRTLFLISTAGMMGSFIVQTICSARFKVDATDAAANSVVAFIFIYYVFYNIAFSGLLVGYSVEILPYNIRAKGMTIMFLCVDLALFFNNYVNPVALKAIEWKYYIVYCCWLGFELFVVWKYYIETRNTPLEEICKYFDGDNAIVGGAVATEKSKVLAAEMGGLGTVNMTEKDGMAVEHREL